MSSNNRRGKAPTYVYGSDVDEEAIIENPRRTYPVGVQINATTEEIRRICQVSGFDPIQQPNPGQPNWNIHVRATHQDGQDDPEPFPTEATTGPTMTIPMVQHTHPDGAHTYLLIFRRPYDSEHDVAYTLSDHIPAFIQP